MSSKCAKCEVIQQPPVALSSKPAQMLMLATHPFFSHRHPLTIVSRNTGFNVIRSVFFVGVMVQERLEHGTIRCGNMNLIKNDQSLWMNPSSAQEGGSYSLSRRQVFQCIPSTSGAPRNREENTLKTTLRLPALAARVHQTSKLATGERGIPSVSWCRGWP